MRTPKELTQFFTVENRNGLKSIENYLKTSYNELYREIITHHNTYFVEYNETSFKEKIYQYIHDLREIPKCKVCGKIVNFTDSLIKGYRSYCSIKCSGTSPERRKRTMISNLKKYGVINPLNSCEIIDKIKETNLKKYGVDNPFKLTEIQNKIKKTVLDKYGVNHYSQTNEFKEKYKTTINKKYGVDYYSQTDEFKEKYKTTISKKHEKNKTKKRIYKITDKTRETLTNMGYSLLKGENDILEIKHPNGHIFSGDSKFILNRLNQGIELSTLLQPKYYSSGEIEISNYIKDIGIANIMKNKRKILNGLELDIYIPNHNLAIEYNGIYYHSTNFKDKYYHINKTNLCEERGIQLLHIFEDEWINKQDIVKSILIAKLNLIDRKIYARKCIITEINDNKIIKDFLKNNHILGYVGSNFKLGLFYENELVSLMTFGKKRIALGNKKVNDGEYELLRYCNKLNTQVIGGANKLFKYFIKTYSPKLILTFADRRYSNGNLYNKLGFEFIENTKPNYWYFEKNTLNKYHRFNFRKDILVKEGYDPSKTENEIMLERGFHKVYDSGNMKFILKLG